jgi:hypothetical protein
MNDLVILFDLEATTIEHWSNPVLINQEKIKRVLSGVNMGDMNKIYGIYSYALWCDENIEIFNSGIRSKIENEFDIAFDDEYIFHMNDIMDNFASKNAIINYRAYCLTINKEKSILDFHVRNPKFYRKDIMLIDDTVQHAMTITYPDIDSIPDPKTIMFVNPNHIKGE